MEKITKFRNDTGTNISLGLDQTETKLGISKTINLEIESEKNLEWEPPSEFDGGCAKMYITETPPFPRDSQILWNGIIPLGSTEYIKISSPANGKIKVFVADGELPECKEGESCFCNGKGKKNRKSNVSRRVLPSWWWILFAVTILFGFVLIHQTIGFGKLFGKGKK